VLPPYVYSTDWREMQAHFSAIISETPLSCMLYNNPIAYKTDFVPDQIAELAAKHENLDVVKESSADVRRRAGQHAASVLYRWILPLLRMDTVPKFVPLIKWVQESMRVGSARVPPPRLAL
jgi:hypothetical protein